MGTRLMRCKAAPWCAGVDQLEAPYKFRDWKEKVAQEEEAEPMFAQTE